MNSPPAFPTRLHTPTKPETKDEPAPWIFLVFHGLVWCKKEDAFVLAKTGAPKHASFLGAPSNGPPNEPMWFVNYLRNFEQGRGCLPIAIVDADFGDDKMFDESFTSDGARFHLSFYADTHKIPYFMISRAELYDGAHPDTGQCPGK